MLYVYLLSNYNTNSLAKKFKNSHSTWVLMSSNIIVEKGLPNAYEADDESCIYNMLVMLQIEERVLILIVIRINPMENRTVEDVQAQK